MMYREPGRWLCPLAISVTCLTTSMAGHAASLEPSMIVSSGQISEIITHTEPAEASSFQVDSIGYDWGLGENLILDGVVLGDQVITPVRKANSVRVVRRELPSVATGELCGVFAEQARSDGTGLKPSFVPLAGNALSCDMAELLMSNVVNRGTLDTFTNTGRYPNNIERLDYRFDGGLIAPLDAQLLPFAGHVVGEKQGNNRVHAAAILAIDASSEPSAYGPLVRIGRAGECTASGICYGKTPVIHDYSFIQSPPLEPAEGARLAGRSTEPVAFAYVSMSSLGLSPGSVYYGISLFPSDIDPTIHDLLDVTSFPTDTQEPDISANDSADIYGGSAAVYEAEVLPGLNGRVLCETEPSELAPVAGVPVQLFEDGVPDGVFDPAADGLLATLPGTGADGAFSFSGLQDNTYFVVVERGAAADPLSGIFVVNGERVDNADILLGEPCNAVQPPVGPVAVDDALTLASTLLVPIPVLENDRNRDGLVNAPELTLVSVSDSSTATLLIQDRTVLYSASEALRAEVRPGNPVTDQFTYELEDDQGLRSMATVTLTLVPQEDPQACFDQGRTDCLFVETEVDGIGVGRWTVAQLLVLLCMLVLRNRSVRIATRSALS